MSKYITYLLVAAIIALASVTIVGTVGVQLGQGMHDAAQHIGHR